MLGTRRTEVLILFLFQLASRTPAAVFYVNAGGTNPSPPYASWDTAATNIQDAVSLASLNDLVLVTNGLYQYGGTAQPSGNPSNRVYVSRAMTLQSVNGPAVTTIRGITNANELMRCVYLADGAVLSGFTAINGGGGGIYCAGKSALITNCIIMANYASGSGGGIFSGSVFGCSISNNIGGLGGGGAFSSALTNCIIAGNGALIGSGGGISGGSAFNCSISNNSCINGNGGGAASSSLLNCLLISNSAEWAANSGTGGGAASSYLTNCVLIGNRAGYIGGGASGQVLVGCLLYRNYCNNYGGACSGTLINCTVVSNSSPDTGGLYTGTAFNSVLYYNSGAFGANYTSGYGLTNCCTTPLPAKGVDNFTNPPVFVNLASGDFHLRSNSPCINSGNNKYWPLYPPGFIFPAITNDLDGNPRFTGGTIDVGAYEFQSPASIISYAWLQQYGFPTDGSADFSDPDGDGMNNWQEWIAGTDPTDAQSVLTMLPPSNSVSGLTLTWQSVTNRTYYLERATNLLLQPAFTPIAGPITGQPGVTAYTGMTASNSPASFYRVSVQR
ncbi:MAG: hypothetical protein C5B50_22080 [Verrucomicrobia bacterium]|nr:MAG: hypothetical protein C5B50_22080 [Verrucomicrobiota bacterium]